MEQAKSRSNVSTRTRSIAFVALTIAIIAVSAWVTVPIGPIPFTLQMFAITFAIVVLEPKQAIAAIAGYLALGAVGVPVFSGMRGGFGVLAGPTGGFLWGYIFGVTAAVLLLWAIRPKLKALAERKSSGRFIQFMENMGVEILAGCLFTAIAYLCGWVQYMAVAGVSPQAAFLTCIAPFVVVDLCKIIAACICARSVKTAVDR